MYLRRVQLLLIPLSWLYGLAVSIRHFLYNRKWLRSFSFDFPVILVGNISTGGTGKTPHVLEIARLLSRSYRVAVLSRGYKRKTKGYLAATTASRVDDIGDEPTLMKFLQPELEVAVCEDRLAGITLLLQEEPAPELILMDDGFQHRAVRAGYNIILTDYNKPFTKDRLLPAGRLREPVSSLQRADMIIVSKCPPEMTKREAAEMRTSLKLLPAHQLFFTCYKYLPRHPLLPEVNTHLNTETPQNCFLVHALASADYLMQHLQKQGKSCREIRFPDHHYYTKKDLEKLKATCGEAWILTTEKDAVKLLELEAEIKSLQLHFMVCPVQVEFLFDGGEKFATTIRRYIKDAQSLM